MHTFTIAFRHGPSDAGSKVVNGASGSGGKAGGKDGAGGKVKRNNGAGGKDGAGGTVWRHGVDLSLILISNFNGNLSSDKVASDF